MTDEPTESPPRRFRYLWGTLALVTLALAMLGVFLPVLPTTPFLLVTLWAGDKASPRFRTWVMQHRIFGPTLRQWYEQGAVSTGAKLLATSVMLSSWSYLLWKDKHWILLLGLGLFFLGVLSFLWTRPAPQKNSSTAA